MRIYRGHRTDSNEAVVTVEEHGEVCVLTPDESLRIVNHSPTGFNWGYGGSGPAQLAFALLYDATDHRPTSERHYQAFKWSVVCCWGDTWSITDQEIIEWAIKAGDYMPTSSENGGAA